MRSPEEIQQALRTVENSDAASLETKTRNTVIDVLRWVLGMSSYLERLLMMLSVVKGPPS